MIDVAGARLNVLELGRRDAAGAPIVMLHGASSNLEVMRQPLGEPAREQAPRHPDRPSRPWLELARKYAGFDARRCRAG